MKKTAYNFLKKVYPKHLILFTKKDKIYRYNIDYNLYQKSKNISYIIIYNNHLIKKDYLNNLYDLEIVKYKLINTLKKVGKI